MYTCKHLNIWLKNPTWKPLKTQGKLHFITLNYTLDYTLHPKLSDCTLCTLNYHTYHTLHAGVIFVVIFNGILLHVTSTCFLFRWNKIKRLKHLSLKSIKTKLKNFHISLCLTWCHPLPHPPSLVKRNVTSLKAWESTNVILWLIFFFSFYHSPLNEFTDESRLKIRLHNY